MTAKFPHVGERIHDVTITSEQEDEVGRVVYAMLSLRASASPVAVPPFHRFTLEVMTKGYFSTSHGQELLSDLAHVPDSLEGLDVVLETKEPYVLNDEDLSEEVIRRKFMGRVIEADLAASLWEVDTAL